MFEKQQYTRVITRTSVLALVNPHFYINPPQLVDGWVYEPILICTQAVRAASAIRERTSSVTNQEDSDEQPLTPSHISPFERIRQVAEDDSEYWLARDLATVLDYTQWRNFEQAIERAIRAARNSG